MARAYEVALAKWHKDPIQIEETWTIEMRQLLFQCMAERLERENGEE